ncbi:hypothetical protein V6N11_033800 [Hibiscus sabdariffa]|uniref:Uncharacterized protein n=1 Tax=Hibiscus sabdariffa TaxID=183260 RepID=A0ABR2S0I7_9ROSI
MSIGGFPHAIHGILVLQQQKAQKRSPHASKEKPLMRAPPVPRHASAFGGDVFCASLRLTPRRRLRRALIFDQLHAPGQFVHPQNSSQTDAIRDLILAKNSIHRKDLLVALNSGHIKDLVLAGNSHLGMEGIYYDLL